MTEKIKTSEALKALIHAKSFCQSLDLEFDNLKDQQKALILLAMRRCGDELFDMPDWLKTQIAENADAIVGDTPIPVAEPLDPGMTLEEDKTLTREAVKAMACAIAFCSELGLSFDKLNKRQQLFAIEAMRHSADHIYDFDSDQSKKVQEQIETMAQEINDKI